MSVLVILLDIVRIAFGRLPLVHRVEVYAGIIGLDGLEEISAQGRSDFGFRPCEGAHQRAYPPP